eukprot:CAMPEP_0175780236 /NCGR_PEP_ID=MMETSP0097-20121207/76642_1 /TAXON_ID=311494 /ORGANISM="Alexandrium monilatum, Strain CCMP3105" /LENGTH=31 /DNA_ID= /DNA_START= /DNA_END= /DNA_ORIENTATION=
MAIVLRRLGRPTRCAAVLGGSAAAGLLAGGA